MNRSGSSPGKTKPQVYQRSGTLAARACGRLLPQSPDVGGVRSLVAEAAPQVHGIQRRAIVLTGFPFVSELSRRPQRRARQLALDVARALVHDRPVADGLLARRQLLEQRDRVGEVGQGRAEVAHL